MTIKKYASNPKREIFLKRAEGNAFVILATAMHYAPMFGIDKKHLHKEMTSGNYENLIQVFDKYFGVLFDIILEDEEEIDEEQEDLLEFLLQKKREENKITKIPEEYRNLYHKLPPEQQRILMEEFVKQNKG